MENREALCSTTWNFAANEINQAIRLTLAFELPFSLDLIVRTPEYLERALEEGDWFLSEVVTKGKIVYEKSAETPP